MSPRPAREDPADTVRRLRGWLDDPAAISRAEERGVIPGAVLARLAEEGLLAPELPPELGGAGLPPSGLGVLCEEFGRTWM